MLNVAMLSKWHVHAEGYAKDFLATGKVNIPCVWDEDVSRGRAWAEELGAAFEPNLDKLLSRGDVDAVCVGTPTTMHEEVMRSAAQAGKHIFTEKVLAPTVAECERIATAIEKAGVTFAISLPQRTMPVVLLAKEMVEKGEFGKISMVRIRNGHNGISGGWLPPYWLDEGKAAGGALLDLGCHPAYIASFLFGEPKRASAMLTAPLGSSADESACATYEFAGGVIVECETSFVTFDTPDSIEIYGTEGTLLRSRDRVRVKTRATAAFTDGYITPKMPAPTQMPIPRFVDACVNGTGSPAGFAVSDGITLTRLLSSAYTSNRENRIVTF